MKRVSFKGLLERKTTLEELWPPKWFIAYADLAILLMTFFIVLATMLSLKIPLYALADKKTQEFLKKEYQRLEEIRHMTEEEKGVLETIKEIDLEQINPILELKRIKEFGEELRSYIIEKNLDDFIIIKEEKYKLSITPLEAFLFEKGKDRLKIKAKEFIDRIAIFMRENPSIIQIEGHTDNLPIKTVEFPSNWELSIARANSVLKYLVKNHNIEPSRIYAIGYGENRPIAPNDSEENRSKNRRVVFELIPELKEVSE